MKFKQSEADTKRAIIQYLKIRGHMVMPYRTTGIKTTTKGWIPATNTGIADLLGLTKDGRFFAIEVKSITGHITIEQERFLGSVRSHGCKAFVARSVDDVIREGL